MSQEPDRKLKVGVIGVGGIAATHVPGWKQSPYAELVAGSDVSPDILSRWGAGNGVTKLYAKPEDLIADPEIDIVDVCTPSAFHAPLSIAALEAGKHVLCEKPLAPSAEEIRQMIAARDRSGKLLMTAQHMRFRPEARAMKAEIDAGMLGPIYHARSWQLRRGAIPARVSFVTKAQAGGGPCIDIGVHVLDLTVWMMGHPKAVSVTGVARRELADLPGAFSVWGGTSVPKEIDVEDFACGFVRFENGATLMLEVSWMLHHDTKGEDQRIWLYGKEGGAEFPACRILRTNNRTKQLYNTELTYIPGGAEPHAAECMAFAEAVAKGQPSPVPPEESLIVQQILTALYRSQESGREVAIEG